METSEFDYELPASAIAQQPLSQRDNSRLLHLNRASGGLSHLQFTDLIALLEPGDLLVGNNSRVMPARLIGKKSTGGKVELLLLEQVGDNRWRALAGGKKLRPGAVFVFGEGESRLTATIVQVLDGAIREVTFDQPVTDYWEQLGETPLPPYIHASLNDSERYQTIYARPMGSAAAPTAGLHFSPDLLLALREKGVNFEMVTLHVGLDTFKPVEAKLVADHPIHSEWIQLTAQSAKRINETKLAGKRVIAIGTTSVRVLETAAWRSAGETGSLRQVSLKSMPASCPWQPVSAIEGRTDLYIYPGYNFRVVDGLITNFHLPQSSLMMLVSAFAGIKHIRAAYAAALTENYRFLSFGDAMIML